MSSLLQLETPWRRCCISASWAFDDLLLSLQEAFWFGWGDDMFFWILLGSPWVFDGIRAKALFFLLSFLLFFLVYLSNGALYPFNLVFQLLDCCDLKSSRLRILILKQADKTSRYFVCVRSSSRLGRLRVGSVDASGRLLAIWVGSPFCSHFELFLPSWLACIRVGSSGLSQFGRSGRVGSWTLGSARVLVCSEHSWACHDRVGSTIIRVGSST